MEFVGCRTANESIVLREDVTLSFGTKKEKSLSIFKKRGKIQIAGRTKHDLEMSNV